MMKNLLLLFALFWADHAQAAEDCHLKQLASLPLESGPISGAFYVPVEIAGVERKFLLEPDAANSSITSAIADELNLHPTGLPPTIKVDYFGYTFANKVELPELELGTVKITNISLLLFPNPPPKFTPDGVLGHDILSVMGAEFDFGGSKMNLFSQSHCEGNVVYWAKQYAVVPFNQDALGHIYFNMDLDGHSVSTSFSFMPGNAMLDSNTAWSRFGIDQRSIGPKEVDTNENRPSPPNRYSFKSLSLGGLTISNPSIEIYGSWDDNPCNGTKSGPQGSYCFGGAELHLRMNELKKLHLYFSYGEKKLYVTAANAQP